MKALQKLSALTKVKVILGIDPPFLMNESDTRKWFFQRVERKFSPYSKEHRKIELAYDDAERAFRDKLRDSGERYFQHIVSVAIIVLDYLRICDVDSIVAALLHDIVEDTDWMLDEIARKYGDNVANLLFFLTKPRKEEFGGSKELRDHLYHERFRMAPREFFFIKLSDRLHNLLTLWDCDEEKFERKVRETELYYLYYAERECILIHELEAAIQELRESMRLEKIQKQGA